MNEEKLYKIFDPIGHVSSIKIPRDKVTQKPLGYAYVNFDTNEDATDAIAKLNYTIIDGKECRIMWKESDPTRRHTGEGNLFIKNIPKSYGSKDLHELFSKCGEIFSCKVAMNLKTNESLCYGYVQYINPEDAKKAIEEFNDKVVVEGCEPLHVEVYKHKNSDQEWTNCYVKHFPSEWTTDDLKAYLEKYAQVQSVLIIKNNGSQFAYANFYSHEDAVKVVEELHDKPIAEESAKEFDKNFYIQRHMRKEEREALQQAKYKSEKALREEKTKGCNLFVKNIDTSVTDEEFNDLFAKYGTITSSKIERKNNNTYYGYVCYQTPEEANKAIQSLHGYMLKSHELYVTLHQSKEEREKNRSLANPVTAIPSNYYYYPNMPRQPYMMPNMNGPYPYMMPNMPPEMNNNMKRRNAKNNYNRYNNRYENSMMYPPYQNYMAPGMMNPNEMVNPRMPQAAAQGYPYASTFAPAPMSPFEQSIKDIPLPKKEDLMKMNEIERKNELGTYIYTCVNFVAPQQVAKITGMMLELPFEELYSYISVPKVFEERIQDAINILTEKSQSA